ncbi:MAG: undecaprenyl-diphosphate phosphatase [Pseudomonadota bacterium]
MSLFYLFILAAVQGITEFLPVSSSAHLVLLPGITGYADQGLVIDVAVHVGALLAVLLYFRQDILAIAAAFTFGLKDKSEEVRKNRRLGKMVILASLPVILAGLAMHIICPDGIRDPLVIAVMTIVFAGLLWWADRGQREIKPLETLNKKAVLLIGLAQVLALVPGTSRSGVTMTAGLFLGLSRVEAARFSLLLSIPAILGAGLLKGIEIIRTGDTALGLDALIGAALSFVMAYLAISVMMRWLKTSSFTPFVIYRMILGSVLLLYIIL